MGCACQATLLARQGAPKAAARLRIDHAALRAALGGRAEVVEAMEAKATGRPGVNVARIWSFMTTSVYQSGDLPVLATREGLQNGIDAIRAAIRARKTRAGEGRFAVTWDPGRRALSFEDNGIGMDATTILTKFLSLGDSGKRDAGDSEEAAGGFGVAKAVILGTSRTFRWEMHTRDNLALSTGADAEVQVFDAPYLQGTRITVFDVPEDFDSTWDDARRAYVVLPDRLRELLAANDLPGLTLVLDGEEVRPMFSRRGGAKVAVDGSWGQGTTATVKAFRRPPGDRQGAYYLRLGGLFQHKVPSQRGNLKADVVVDLLTTVRPGTAGYPFNAARDALQDHARWAFRDLVEEVERENESVGRSQEDEVYDPDSDDEAERRGAAELADLAAEAFGDAAFQKAMAEAAGGIADFYAERAKDPGVESPVASLAPPGTRAPQGGDGPTRSAVLPPGVQLAATATPVEPDVACPGGPASAVRQLRDVLQSADDAVIAAGGGYPFLVLTSEVQDALDRAEAGEALGEHDVVLLQGAIARAADAATGPSGGGLLQAATLTRAGDVALAALTTDEAGERRRRVKRNPFGRLAGLRISKKNYDRQRAYRFRKGFARWIPHLTAWDATLRLIAAEARIRRRFKPGFVLDDELLGLTTSTPSGGNVVYIHPDRLDQVVRAHRERPLAIAAYLHGVACHELTHLDGRMGQGHSEEYVAAREDLGHATGHLLPAIAILVEGVLRLPVKVTEEQKRIAALERQLARARAARLEERRSATEVARLQAALDDARAALAEAEAESARVRVASEARCPTCGCADPAALVLDAAAAAVAARPPAGVDAAYVAAFVGRHRDRLVALVRAGLARPGIGASS
ncbi:hypothetical protein L6R50_09120 [Myxococcota bacterium]|nr:hypothetical protein [Myxococcota bacterium]